MNIYHGKEFIPTESEYLNKVSLAIQPDRRTAFLLAKKDEVPFVYHIAKLEGNPLAYEQVKTLMDGVSVGGCKLSDVQMIINLQKSFDFIMEKTKTDTFEVNQEFVLKLHSIVAYEEALEWGKFRLSAPTVQVGDDQFVSPRHETPDMMLEKMVGLLNREDHHPLDNAFAFFAAGAYNQLFYDGNKRTARLVASAYLLNLGYPPISILQKNTLPFHQSLSELYRTGSSEKLSDFLTDNYIEYAKQIGYPYIDEKRIIAAGAPKDKDLKSAVAEIDKQADCVKPKIE